jgi:Icc protein
MQRRSALKNIGGLLLVPTLGLANTSVKKQPVLRIAHLTDIHLKNKFDAPARFTKCLHHVQQQSPKVDLILNGGDVVLLPG